MTIVKAARKQESKLFWQTVATVAENIKAKRNAMGLTQRAFAPLVGLSQASIMQIESGNRRIPLSWVVNCADALGVPVHLLFVPNSFGPVPKRKGR